LSYAALQNGQPIGPDLGQIGAVADPPLATIEDQGRSLRGQPPDQDGKRIRVLGEVETELLGQACRKAFRLAQMTQIQQISESGSAAR